jgi:hypothetical protein
VIALFFALLIGHALCDYPLQSDFMAKGKNRHWIPTNIPPGQERQTVWPWILSAHAGVHAGAVWLITASWELAALEFIAHWTIDNLKCDGWYGIHTDQALHIACKATWVALLWTVFP